jgi:hypothetical protein
MTEQLKGDDFIYNVNVIKVQFFNIIPIKGNNIVDYILEECRRYVRFNKSNGGYYTDNPVVGLNEFHGATVASGQ